MNKKNEGPYYRREKLSTTRTKKITRKQSFRDNDEDIDEDYNNIEDEETERKKKIKKKTMAEQYEEKIKKYREYLSICEDINKEIKEYDKKFESIKKDYLTTTEKLWNINSNWDQNLLDIAKCIQI